jgi:transposase-like protein
MKARRFTEQQIAEFLRQADEGVPVTRVCRQGGFSDTTFYRWRKQRFLFNSVPRGESGPASAQATDSRGTVLLGSSE